MAEEVTTTPEVEVNTPETETTVETTPEVVEEKTISEMVPETEPEKAPNMIPESVFLGEKKARKEAEKEIKRLTQLIEGGASKEDISDSIAELAEEHDLDPKFLTKFASTIKAQAEKELEEKFNSKFESKEKESKFEEAFNKAYQVAMDRAPEFASIANTEVLKALALLPQNAKKTLSQILEETYGNAIQGKRTIENTTPGGGKEPEPLDFEKASNDINYFNEIMKDPKKKEQYNAQMIKKGF